MRAGLLFTLLRLIGTAGVLVSTLLFLVTLFMLALGLQTPVLLLAVIQWRSGQSDVEISGGEIIRAGIIFFRAQRFLEPFDGIRGQRLDWKEHTRRQSARGFCAILLEPRQRLLDTDDTGHAWPLVSAGSHGFH